MPWAPNSPWYAFVCLAVSVKEDVFSPWISILGLFLCDRARPDSVFRFAAFYLAAAGSAPACRAMLTANGTSNTVAPTLDITKVKKVASIAITACNTQWGTSPSSSKVCSAIQAAVPECSPWLNRILFRRLSIIQPFQLRADNADYATFRL